MRRPRYLRDWTPAVPDRRSSLLHTALRLQWRGHPELARQVILLCLFAEALAGAGHDGPPHRSYGRPRSDSRRAARRSFRESLAGRRPRG
jgi:hypothetical protein